MTGHVLGIYRLAGRPLPPADALAAQALGAGAAVRHADEDLLLLSAGPGVPALASDQGGTALAWGRITGCLEPLPGGLAPRDPQTLLHLRRQHGESFARLLDGHFAAVVIDRQPRRLRLYQDRFPGIVTAYWLVHDGLLMFSDRIRPLLRMAPAARDRLDRRALHQYLADTYVTAPATIYAAVRQLAAGERLTAGEGEVTTELYDDWRRPAERMTDPGLALARYRELLADAIARWLERAPGSGFLLSGGLDSSVNVALAAERGVQPLRTFGIAAAGLHADAPYARRVASRFGATYREHTVDGGEIDDLPRLVWAFENPFFEPGMMLTWSALSLAAAHTDAVVGGEVADQLFGACAVPAWRRHRQRRRLGPLWKPWLALVHGTARQPGLSRWRFARRVEERLVRRHHPASWCGRYGFRNADLPALLRRGLPEDDRYDTLALPDHDLDALFDHGCTVLNRDYAVSGILPANGRLGDLLGVATFSPFCDRRLADLVLGLATDLRCPEAPGQPGTFTYKALHRDLARTLLERDVVERPKQGGAITPTIHLRDADRLASMRRALLASPFIDDLCRREALEALLVDPRRNAVRILQLVTLDLWHHLDHERGDAGAPDFTLGEFLAMRGDRAPAGRPPA